MKILILNYEYPPLGGGGGRVARDLAGEWVKMGHSVDVVTSHFKNLKKFERLNGVNIYRVPIFGRKDLWSATFLSMFAYLFSGFWRGFWLCRKNKYDLLNTHFAIPTGPLGLILSKIFHIKNILDLHGGDIYNPGRKTSPHKSWFYRVVVRWVLNNADKIVAHSRDVMEKTREFYQPRKKINIVPIGFKLPEFKKLTRRELDLEENKFYLVSVGRLVPRKRIDYTIEALSKICDLQIELLIIGDGPEKKKLENLAIKLNIATRVHFLGFVSEEKKFQYLFCADALISTSEHEGFGINFQEAMFCGLAIVADDRNGGGDFLRASKNTYFCDSHDVSYIVNAIMCVKQNKCLLDENTRFDSNVISQFELKNIAQQYLQ